jgi:hypothetical protein
MKSDLTEVHFWDIEVTRTKPDDFEPIAYERGGRTEPFTMLPDFLRVRINANHEVGDITVWGRRQLKDGTLGQKQVALAFWLPGNPAPEWLSKLAEKERQIHALACGQGV